jgi:NitT/TauT family transport system substrate-binding protein
MRRTIGIMLVTFVAVISVIHPALSEPRDSFKVAWSIYTPNMPWGWADDNGIVKKWADKFGITITSTKFTDYVESINQYTSGEYDALLVTNMDTIVTPAVGGIDNTVIVVQDYSNGNDAVILKGKDKTLEDIKGQTVHLILYSVNHYILTRALESVGLSEQDVSLVNLSDADQVAAFNTSDVTAMAAFHPTVYELSKRSDTVNVFNSSMIPGEILDMIVAHTDVVTENPNFGNALACIWFDVLEVTLEDSERGRKARRDMGIASGTDLAGFDAQLETTHFFHESDHKEFVEGDQIIDHTDRLREFLYGLNLLGATAKSSDAIGVEFPSGHVSGGKENIKLRFTDDYVGYAKKECDKPNR